MSKQSKINPKSMSLLAVQGLDWCLRKAFLWFFLIMVTLFLNVLFKTMPGQQALLFVSIIEGIYLASFTFRVIQKYRNGSELLVYTVLISFIEMLTLCVLLLRPTHITETEVTYILVLLVISLILYVVGLKLSSILFKRYLFKNVMDVDYLGLKKSTETSLYNEHSLINDIELTSHDSNAQMTMINKNAVKPEYRSIVEVTNMEYEKVISPRYYREGTAPGKPQGNIKHTFETKDTLYHLHFNFHPFGINGRFSPSYLPLIDLTVSENKAK
jgi:hypothetical protein